MTDTPRSNELSPVVFMGSGGPDLTAPETAVDAMGQWVDALNTALGDRTKLATKIGQSIEFNEIGTAALSEFIGGLSEAIQALAARHDALSAKLDAAEARERALLQEHDTERKVLVKNASLRHRLKVAEAERDALDAAWSERVALLEKTISKTEAERDAALGVLRDLGFDNAFSVYQAARQKGGEG